MLAQGQFHFDDGMSALMDVDDIAVVDDGSHIVLFFSRLGEGEQAVHLCHERSVLLNGGNNLSEGDDQFVEQACLQRQYLVLCP